jgi:glucokinase
VPIARQIAEEIPAPVFIDSDRTAYVVGEHWRGVARGRTDVAFVAIGTGIGVGIMIEGNLCRGAQDIAGAAGWFALNREWNAGYATKGCWESEAAGPAIAAKAGVASVQEVIDRSSDGDANATRVLEDAAGWIGMGIANIVSLLNPQIVVLGGGVMQFAPPFMIDRIRSEARRWAQPIAIQTTAIELSSLGADAGLLGAARIAYLRLGDNRE